MNHSEAEDRALALVTEALAALDQAHAGLNAAPHLDLARTILIRERGARAWRAALSPTSL